MEKKNMMHVIEGVEAVYPRINRPYRFDQKVGKTMPCEAHEDGAEYRLQFRMTKPQAAELYKAMSNAYAASRGDNWPDQLPMTFRDEGDGHYVGNAKIKAQYNNQITRPIGHFDSAEPPNELPEGFELTNGSTVNIACVLIPYNTPQAGAGVSLRLSAVQVIKLAERQGYNPFSGVDGGFTNQQAQGNPFVADEEITQVAEVAEDPFAEPEEKPKVKSRKKKAAQATLTDVSADVAQIMAKFPDSQVDDPK